MQVKMESMCRENDLRLEARGGCSGWEGRARRDGHGERNLQMLAEKQVKLVRFHRLYSGRKNGQRRPRKACESKEFSSLKFRNRKPYGDGGAGRMTQQIKWLKLICPEGARLKLNNDISQEHEYTLLLRYIIVVLLRRLPRTVTVSLSWTD